MSLPVGVQGLRHTSFRHPEQLGDLAGRHRGVLRARPRDQLATSVDQLVLLRELHGNRAETTTDLFRIEVVLHENKVTEPSSWQGGGCGVSLHSRVVASLVIFVIMVDSELLDSAQVAKRLDVTVGRVYKLRVGDPSFPAPVAFRGRSPLYASNDIESFIQERSGRAPATRGRRPRRLAPGVVDPSLFSERLRQTIASGVGRPDVMTQADLIALLGLNPITFGHRMRGRTRWRPSELDEIRRRLGMDTTDANEVVDARRRSR